MLFRETIIIIFKNDPTVSIKLLSIWLYLSTLILTTFWIYTYYYKFVCFIIFSKMALIERVRYNGLYLCYLHVQNTLYCTVHMFSALQNRGLFLNVAPRIRTALCRKHVTLILGINIDHFHLIKKEDDYNCSDHFNLWATTL